MALFLLPHSDVQALAFSSNGRLLATANADKSSRLWLCLPAGLIAEARSRLNCNLTLEGWQQYLGDEPYRKTVPDLP